MKFTFYINREDAKTVEEEERHNFLRSILTSIGIPFEDIWPEDAEITNKIKIELRSLLQKYDITILDKADKSTDIYVDKDLIGQWKRPTYKLKHDASQIVHSKKVFLEMTIEYESVFDEQPQ
jgi:hypothetical protein